MTPMQMQKLSELFDLCDHNNLHVIVNKKTTEKLWFIHVYVREKIAGVFIGSDTIRTVAKSEDAMLSVAIDICLKYVREFVVDSIKSDVLTEEEIKKVRILLKNMIDNS